MDEKDDKTLPVSYSEAQAEQKKPFSSRFKNLKFLGEGGSGRVYKAYDSVLNEYVAIKLISKKGLPEETKKRILREVKVSRNLTHENLVKYYDINEDENYIVIVMEYIEGASIDKKIKKEGSFKEEEIKKILFSLIDVIKYLHNNGIIHRDIKPANIFITKDGKVKLGDFGIIHLKEDYEKLTKTEQAIGTPTYMSPEQITGKDIDEKSDYYSLGITIYEMIQGDVPFSGTIGEIIKGHFEKEIPEVKSSKVFNKLIKGLTIKDPKKRWGYEELLKYIEEKRLPLLPKQKRILRFSFSFLFFIFLFYFILLPKILRTQPTQVDFNGKNLKVFGKNKLLFKKEMEKKISDAKVVGLRGEKEILLSYNLKPEDFTKDPLNYIKIGEKLNNKGGIKNIEKIQELAFVSNFNKFSLNYSTTIFPFHIIKDGKIKEENYYLKIYHKYYPCLLYFSSETKEDKNFFLISHSGHIEGICEWEGKIVAIGFNNLLFHQLFIALIEKKNPVQLTFKNSDLLDSVISYYLLGYYVSTVGPEFKMEKDKLKIKVSAFNENFLINLNGDLEGLKSGVGEITKKFLTDYNNIKYLLEKENFEKAKNLIEENLNLSEIFKTYGWTVVFASFFSDLKFLQGEKEKAIDICLEYAKKYEKWGFDLNNKAGFLAILSENYDKASEIWEGKLYGEGFRSSEVSLYPVFSAILKEDWKKVDKFLSSENFAAEGIWYNYLRYLKGLAFLIQKNTQKAGEILKDSLMDIEQEDNSTFYFLAKYLTGNPDKENYDKFIRNYPSGPLYLQFAGACTKGELDKAKIVYQALEKEAIWDSGASLIFPIIKKIVKIYPEKFKFLQEIH